MKSTPHVLTLLLIATLTAGSTEGTVAAGDRRAALMHLVQLSGEHLQDGEPLKCGLPIVSHAISHQANLDAAGKSALASVLDRPTMQTSILVGGSYRIHFDTTGGDAAAMLDAQYQRIPGSARQFVDSAAAILLNVLTVELLQLGYPTPPSDGTAGGGPEYDIYILDLGNMYGYTTPDFGTPAGSVVPNYITIDNDFIFVTPSANRGIPALKVTVAHEFSHAVQMGRYGYWSGEVAFYEMTATWLEDVLYTEVNDYVNYLHASWSYFRKPGESFMSDGLSMYSRCTWVHYLAKKFGVDGVRACWEEVAPSPPQRPNPTRPLRAIDNALRRYSSDFPSAFAEWGVWNYFTGYRANPLRYYPEGETYPLVTRTPLEFIAPERLASTAGSTTIDVLGTKYYHVLSGADTTLTIALVNTDIDSYMNGFPSAVSYDYSLKSQRTDDSYRPTGIGLYGKLIVPNEATWQTWFLVRDTVQGPVEPSALEEGQPFPSPFHADGQRRVFIPVDATQALRGQLFVFSSGMELVYESADVQSTTYLGRPMFTWDGKTSYSEVAPTGVYVYVIQLRDRRLTGKIALIKE